jgi:hypothetical protein
VDVQPCQSADKVGLLSEEFTESFRQGQPRYGVPSLYLNAASISCNLVPTQGLAKNRISDEYMLCDREIGRHGGRSIQSGPDRVVQMVAHVTAHAFSEIASEIAVTQECSFFPDKEMGGSQSCDFEYRQD